MAALGAFLPKVAVGRDSGAGSFPGCGSCSLGVVLSSCLTTPSAFSGFKGESFCFLTDGCSLGAGGSVSLGLGLASVAAASEAGAILQAIGFLLHCGEQGWIGHVGNSTILIPCWIPSTAMCVFAKVVYLIACDEAVVPTTSWNQAGFYCKSADATS